MSRRSVGRRGTVRVVAGELGGRRIETPAGDVTRPSSDRVREAVFNALESLGVVDGARVLDAFAGSGALGIEALSRGAAHVTFTELDVGAREVVVDNLRALDLSDRAVVLAGDGAEAARRSPVGGWDLVLLDPPYAFAGWSDLLASVGENLADGGIAVIESVEVPDLPEGLHAIRSKEYGGTVVLFATRGAPE